MRWELIGNIFWHFSRATRMHSADIAEFLFVHDMLLLCQNGQTDRQTSCARHALHIASRVKIITICNSPPSCVFCVWSVESRAASWSNTQQADLHWSLHRLTYRQNFMSKWNKITATSRVPPQRHHLRGSQLSVAFQSCLKTSCIQYGSKLGTYR